MTKHWQPGDRIECDIGFALDRNDVAEGFIAGTASTAKTDLMGHKVLPGAFDKSIIRNGLNGPKGIKLLAQHKMDRPAGKILKLETVNNDLKIEAQLFLDVSYVKDLYAVAKQIGGLNFSVGFELEDFEFVDEKKAIDGEYLLIKEGNLLEVSVVTFPAQPEATMSYVKSHETLSEFEKALVAGEFCRSRNEAQKLAKYIKANSHLFLGGATPVVEPVKDESHPLLDVHLLKACTDLAKRANSSLR